MSLLPDALPEWLNVPYIVNQCIAFAPLFSYGATVHSIHKKGLVVGFSVDICCTMMISSLLRINFYLVEPFEITLLKQAIIMVFIHAILLKVALHYKLKTYDVRNLHEPPNVWEEVQEYEGIYSPLIAVPWAVFWSFIRFFDPYYRRKGSFWQWNEEYKYYLFLVQFYVINLITTLIFRDSLFYGKLVGTASLLVESLLPLPQILLMNRLKSVNGFKKVLLLSWYGGDLTKIIYLMFGAKNTTALFVIFGLFQMSLDIVIGAQYVYYKYYYRMDYLGFDEKNSKSIELGPLDRLPL